MSLTITIPGAVNVTTGAMAPAVLTIGVGVPGATGPAGPAGPGVPVGGTAGQYLQKIDGTNYNTDWVTLNLAAYAPLASPTFTGDPQAPTPATSDNDTSIATTAFVKAQGYLTSAPVTSVAGRTGAITLSNTDISGLGTMSTASAADYSTTTIANGLYYPLSGNPSAFLTSASLSGYLTSATAASTYAVIASGQPTSGTVGQVLTKNSGTNYDSSWQTLIPGDRYLTSSTTSLTIDNANKTLTIGTGLSYSPQQDIVISYDAANHMHARVLTYNSGTGVMDVDVLSHSGTGTYAAWTVNVGGAPALQSIVWGDITGVIGNQGDLATALGNKLETSTAASTYAALAGATFSGEVITPASTTSSAGLTITPGVAPTSPVNGELWATSTDLQVRLNGVTETVAEQSWVTAGFYPLTGNPSSFLVEADITGKANLSGATFTGLVGTVASTTTTAGLNIPHGAAPTTPVNGDVWTTTGALWYRINGTTMEAVNAGSTQTISGNKTFSNANLTLGSSTAAGTLNFGTGATISGATKTINIGTNGVSGSTTNINIGSTSGGGSTLTVNATTTFATSFGTFCSGTNTGTVGLATGATTSGNTKTVNIGTAGLAGSTTAITVGNNTGSTTTLQGTTNGVTAAADTNSVALATTAYVVGQAGSATPLVNGTAAVGTSLRYARADHVHPTDTSRAPLASPTFTGTPLSTTAAVDTNTTQIATTAFVVGQAAAATPLVNGTAAVGTSLRYARADHVHGTDTTRAPLASPTFTGTPTLPTGTIATTQTAGNNTTAVATTAFVTAAVPGFATTAEMASPSSTTKVVAPNDVVRMIVNRATFDTQNSSPTFATSGAGAEGYKATNDRLTIFRTPNAGIAGYGQMIYETTGGAVGIHGAKRGESIITQDWGKKIWMSGTVMFSSLGDANTVSYCMLGGRNTVTTGDPSNTNLRGIGWKLVGGGTALKLLTFGWNGSAVAVQETASSFTPVVDQSFDWMIMHAPNVANPATSYCYLYVNDALVATGIYSPADGSINYNYFYQSAESTASVATPMRFLALPVKVWWSRS